MESPANIFSGIPASLPVELTETLLHSSHFRVERIVSLGHQSPADFWYDQDEHEWVLVLEGEALLLLEGEPIAMRMQPGDFVNIPAHRRHRVEWTTSEKPTVWLAIFYRE